MSYAAGWNLVGGPAGTTINGATGPLYTYQAADTSYETIPSGAPLQAGEGYWAYFSTPATLTPPLATAQTTMVALPASHFVMVGNPYDASVTLSGADSVLTYDPVHGYAQTTTLAPGQGAWAFSAGGGMLTLTPN